MHGLDIGDPVQVTIRKCDPAQDEAPAYVTYTVPYAREMRILEALDYIVEELGESLAYHWFCGVKKCGLCALMVNGRPRLACWEPVEAEMVLEPIPNYPVIRDLVVDRSRYTHALMKTEPRLQRSEPYVGFPEPLLPAQMDGVAEMLHCIECLLCDAVCPAYRYSPSFIGPAALVQLARFALDPRDRGARAELAVDRGHLEACVNCYACVEACPAGINILEHAIDALRSLAVEEDRGEIAHHNKVYHDLVLQQVVVNPATLLMRSRGLRALQELPLALALWRRGRLSAAKFLSSLGETGSREDREELAALARRVRESETGQGKP